VPDIEITFAQMGAPRVRFDKRRAIPSRPGLQRRRLHSQPQMFDTFRNGKRRLLPVTRANADRPLAFVA
jgi:hypothetical protein